MKKLKEFRTFQFNITKQRAMGMKNFNMDRRKSLVPTEVMMFKFTEFLARKDNGQKSNKKEISKPSKPTQPRQSSSKTMKCGLSIKGQNS